MLALALLSLAACTPGAGCGRFGVPRGWSGGTVIGDTLYMGTATGEIRALDKLTGETLWKFELKGEQGERAIYGTPAVADGSLYIGGYDSMLYALSLKEGEEGEPTWQERVGGPIVGSPLVVDDIVLVGSSDGNLYAFHPESAEEKWRFRTAGKVWSTPAVDNGVVYFGSLDQNVYAVALEDGHEIWRFPTGGAVSASPVVAVGKVFVGSFDGVFYAVDAATGREAWSFDGAGNWFWTHALIAGDRVLAPSLDGNLYALDIDTGDLLWKLETDGAIVGSPVIVSDMIVVPSDDGKIRLARLRDGSELDRCNIEEKIRTPLVAQGGFVYFGSAGRFDSSPPYQVQWKSRRGVGALCRRGRSSAQGLEAGMLGSGWRKRCD